MDISRFLPGLTRQGMVDGAPSEPVKLDAPKHGPAKVRYISAGQQRRQIVRDRKTHARKATKRNRAQWHRQQHALATLRGQLQTLGLLPWADGECRPGDSVTVTKIELYLDEAWGSVDQALEAYRAATTRR
jgi:hypothetical protein